MKWKKSIIQEKHDFVGTPTYRSWYNMKSRCNNPNYRNSHLWLGRGIKYVPEWERFTFFLRDMGVRPDGTSLDRIDNDKGYSPENCRWATKKQQMNNMSRNLKITYKGETLNLQEWAFKTGIKREVIKSRINRGWTIEAALTLDPSLYRKREPM